MRSYRPLLVTCFSTFLLCSMVLAQDRDPFGSAPVDDPFGASPKPAIKTDLGDADRVKKDRDQNDVAAGIQELQKENAKLKQSLDQCANRHKQLQNELKDTEQNYASLVVRINHLEKQAEEKKARSEYSNKAYTAFLAQLLASEDPQVQLKALENIKDTRNQAALDDMSYAPASFAIWEQLDKLLDSDNKTIRDQAAYTMATILPGRALERGFQGAQSGYWRPITSASAQVAQIRSAFWHDCSFNYDEAPLIEIVEDIETRYGFDFQVDESVDQNTPVSIDVSGQSLGSSLDVVAKKLGLVVSIVGDGLWLLPADNPDTRNTLTYNVRGLLGENITLEKLVELASDQIDKKESKIYQVGKYQLVVKATEKEQRNVSKLLGSLSGRE